MNPLRRTLICAAILSPALLPSLSVAAQMSRDPSRLQLASVHAAIAPLSGGDLLFGKFAQTPVPIASITKVMTAIVVLDSKLPLNERLPIVEREVDPPKNAYSRIRIGSRATRGDLLRITLMSSENLAAYVLARHHPGGVDAFVAAMNARAKEIGMAGARFVDPAGLWPENVASAEDLVKLVRAAHRYPAIREMSTTGQHRVHFQSPRYSLDYGNTNSLVNSSRWDVHLSKTGYLTEAGRCLVMVADAAGKPTVMVFLDSFGSRSPLGDAGRVRRWLETGDSGSVAGAAFDYERERSRALQNGSAARGS